MCLFKNDALNIYLSLHYAYIIRWNATLSWTSARQLEETGDYGL